MVPSAPDADAGVEAAGCDDALAFEVGFPGAGADAALVAAADGGDVGGGGDSR